MSISTATTANVHYPTPASSLPDLQFTWNDADNLPIDFTTDWSFIMKIGQPPNPAAITKTSGFVGTSGLDGTPNLTVSWSTNELSRLKPGRWYFQITATYGPTTQQRIFNGSLRIDQAEMV
jgi:hypothetical protein